MSPLSASTETAAADSTGLAGDGGVAGRDAALTGVAQRATGLRDGALRLKALLDRPLASYYLVLGCSLLLLGVGLMMVLSTSTAYDLDQGLPAYSMFEKQLLGAAVGLVLMWLAAKSPPRLFRGFAYPLLLAAIGGLVLVLLFGPYIDGAKRWLTVAGTQVQPSEFAKLALVVWGADLLARKEKLGQLSDWRHILVPLLPGAALMAMLVADHGWDLRHHVPAAGYLPPSRCCIVGDRGTPTCTAARGPAGGHLMVFARCSCSVSLASHPVRAGRATTGFVSSTSPSLPEPDLLLPAGPGQGCTSVLATPCSAWAAAPAG